MSKKKRRSGSGNVPKTEQNNLPAAQPEKKEREKPEQPAPIVNEAGETVLDQLFGTLESEPDIEQDIAELGTDHEKAGEAAAEQPKKNRFFFVFSIFVIIMAIIGCVSTVRFAAKETAKLFDNTSIKNEFAQFIFPVVVNDIAPFESTAEIPNSTKITCAIWNILINKDTDQYQSPTSMGLTIPEYDVAASCKEIFGSAASVEHQSVGAAEVRFTYDEENHVYSANKNIRYLTYSPQIIEMSEANGIYTLIVGYIPPTVASVAGINGMEVSPEKYMEYTIERWDGKNTLLSVRFCDYKPDAEAVS